MSERLHFGVLRRFLKAKTRQLGLQNVGTRPIGPTLKVHLQSALVAVAGRVWFITEVVMVCLTICGCDARCCRRVRKLVVAF